MAQIQTLRISIMTATMLLAFLRYQLRPGSSTCGSCGWSIDVQKGVGTSASDSIVVTVSATPKLLRSKHVVEVTNGGNVSISCASDKSGSGGLEDSGRHVGTSSIGANSDPASAVFDRLADGPPPPVQDIQLSGRWYRVTCEPLD